MIFSSSNSRKRSTKTQPLHLLTFIEKSLKRCGPSLIKTSMINPFHLRPKIPNVFTNLGQILNLSLSFVFNSYHPLLTQWK